MTITSDIFEKAKHIKLVILDVDGVLTDGSLYAHEDKVDFSVGFFIQDGQGIKSLQKTGIEVAILSGRDSNAVRKRVSQLGIQHAFLGIDNKLAQYKTLRETFALSDEQIAYMGDDWIDIPPMRHAGLKVTVPNAAVELKTLADWETPRSGGQGAVRDLCDLLLKAQDHYDTLLKSYYQ